MIEGIIFGFGGGVVAMLLVIGWAYPSMVRHWYRMATSDYDTPDSELDAKIEADRNGSVKKHGG